MGNRNCCDGQREEIGFMDIGGLMAKSLQKPNDQKNKQKQKNSMSADNNKYMGPISGGQKASYLRKRQFKLEAIPLAQITQSNSNIQNPFQEQTFFMSNSLIKWREQFEKLKHNILNTIENRTSIISKKCWENIMGTLDNQYITHLDREQILQILQQILRINYKNFQILNGYKQEQEFVIDMDQTQFSIQMAQKLKSLKKRVLTRKTQSQSYIKLIKEFSAYPMDFSFSKQLAKKLSTLCKSDIKAFSFLTLYLVISTNKKLVQYPDQLFQTINKLQQQFNQLSIQHPPSVVDTQRDQNTEDKQEPLSRNQFDYNRSVNYPIFNFKQKNSNSKFVQLQKFILQKAKQAKQDLSLFTRLIRPQCLIKGKQFKCSLKIKGEDDVLPTIRILEKIVFSSHYDDFLQSLQQKKVDLITQIKQSQQNNKIGIFNRLWIEIIGQVYQNILQKQDHIVFKVGDLLRGKAMFKSRKDIRDTVSSIQKKIQQLNDPRYVILRTQDKLQQNTKDFKLILNINETLAQLQLVKNMDLGSNEFNHKIYQLKRSKSLTPLFSLNTLNSILCSTFFVNQLQYFEYLLQTEKQKYSSYEECIKRFKSQFLCTNMDIFVNYQLSDHIQKIQEEIQEKIFKINTIIDKGYCIMSEQVEQNRNKQQKNNDSYFQK